MLRILIVEDEALIAMDLRDIFEDVGHTVVGIAATTAEAISIASVSMPFYLAVLDIELEVGTTGLKPQTVFGTSSRSKPCSFPVDWKKRSEHEALDGNRLPS